MRIKLVIVTILIFISNTIIIAQQNRYECLNQNFVENEIKAFQYGHFFNLELKKGADRNKQTVSNYKQQALFYQNKTDEAYDRCIKLPACTKKFVTPDFSSQNECLVYLNSLKERLNELDKQRSDVRHTIGQLQGEHRYSELIPHKKKLNNLSADYACIEEQIKACNCGFVQSETNTDYNLPNTDYYNNSEFDLAGNGWGIKVFQQLNENAGNTISRTINNKYTPVGFAAGAYSNQFIFVEGDILGITNWSLETYTDVYSLQQGITNYMDNGYVPMGISFASGEELHVLYILSHLRASAWQLVESELDLNDVSNDVQPYIYEQYIPVGISVFGGMYYTLLIQLQNSDPANWTIQGYEDNSVLVSQSIDQKVNQGYVPFGYLNEQGVVNVLYVGF